MVNAVNTLRGPLFQRGMTRHQTMRPEASSVLNATNRQDRVTLCFGAAGLGPQSLTAADARTILLRMAIDGELSKGDQLPTLLATPDLDLARRFDPGEALYVPGGRFGSDAPEASANTPLGLLFIRAALERQAGNPTLETALVEYVRDKISVPSSLGYVAIALGQVGFDPGLAPATPGYIQLIQTLGAHRDASVRSLLAQELGGNPSPQHLPEPVVGVMQQLAKDPMDHIRAILAFHLGGNPSLQHLPEPLVRVMQQLAQDPIIWVRRQLAIGLGRNPSPQYLPEPLVGVMQQLAQDGESRECLADGLRKNPKRDQFPAEIRHLLGF